MRVIFSNPLMLYLYLCRWCLIWGLLVLNLGPLVLNLGPLVLNLGPAGA